MSMRGVLPCIIFVLLAVPSIWEPPLPRQSVDGSLPAWSLVHSFHSGDGGWPRIVSYWINVNHYLSKEECQKVVCAVIAEEGPEAYDYLNVSIYYGIDKDSLDGAARAKAYVGGYTWNREIPQSRYRLSRYKDQAGQVIPYENRFSDFNHVFDCGGS